MIYTATFHHAHNYGAMLQAYGLQNALLRIGYDNRIIDYYEDVECLFEKGCSRTNIINNIAIASKISDHKTAYSRFEEFYRDNLLKTRHYDNVNDIKELCHDKDSIFLVGSDQLWKCAPGRNLSPFFSLSFIEKSNLAVSYAVSMGGYHQLDGSNYTAFAEMLKRFESISVRENATCQFISNEFGVSTLQHIDPVFLLSQEEWGQVAANAAQYNISNQYIVCYELVPNELTQSVLDTVKEKTGYSTVVVTRASRTRLKSDLLIRDAGPKEFVNLIKNAEIVVTTSFHGAAFGNLFNKKTFAVLPNNAERMMSLLEILGVSEYGIRSTEVIINLLEQVDDYSQINLAVMNERIRAEKYLKEALRK